jgi:diketogulonate reductase-like aldo/keto reductase
VTKPGGTTIRLNNGVEIPQVGLGVYEARAGDETRLAVRAALELGYRHVDTAKIYGNEEAVGAAIRESGLPREEIFVTTKLWNGDQGKAKTAAAFEASLSRLGLDYVDLYLIHWPVERLRGESWAEMTKLLAAGKCRSIGVSNYTVKHLAELLRTSDVVPAVNQVELSPFLVQKELLDFCAAKNIVVEAYSPLVKARRMKHPILVEVASKYGKTSAQILIRWSMQHDLVVIPKSVKKSRIAENFAVFDFAIAADDMRALDQLDEGFRTSWDPTDVP